MRHSLYVKICGLTCIEDARKALDEGADALGINFVAGTARFVSEAEGEDLARFIGSAAERVAVVAGVSLERCRDLLSGAGFDLVQLHGEEPDDWVTRLGPHAYRALRIGDAGDVEAARRASGTRVLVDARVADGWGGTGMEWDWSLVAPLAAERRLILAGGLSAKNVATAVTQVRPWGVDVASGVEVPGSPRRKDAGRLRDFLREARGAARALA